MSKQTVVFATVVILGFLGLNAAKEADSMAGSWQVDNRFSDAQLMTEATTDYGKTKMNVTLGFARVNGIFRIEGNDPTKSHVDLTIYPATSLSPSINEDGTFLSDRLAIRSDYHVLICFHSKRVVRTSDSQFQSIGNLSLTRVDRNVELALANGGLSEVQADPPSVIHRSSREVTFVFCLPGASGNGLREGNILASGSTSVSRGDFSEMVRTAVSTYWPSLVKEENCEVPVASEASSGSQCTVTILKTPELPEAPQGANGKESHRSQSFNAVIGEHLTILVHLRLMPKTSEEQAGAKN